MAATRTFYEILNVSPDAELVVIEAAYRALMKKYHPDQGGGAADGPSAAQINRAYAVLKDPGRRADYDRNEWIRQRDIQIAAYQPTPPAPRQSNFFGWGGWIVAFVLAGMIALMASKGIMPQVSEAEQARAALLSAPDFRSQPTAVPGGAVTAAEQKEIRAAAFARPPEPEKAPAPPPPATPPVTTDVAVAEPVRAAPPPAPPAARLPKARWHPPSRHRSTAVARRHDKDFLERQGYIY